MQDRAIVFRVVEATVCVAFSVVSPAAAQDRMPCASDAAPPAAVGTMVPETPRNTLVFNHYYLAATRKGPHVLAVKDGDYLQVRFICTDPRKFNYTITANTDAQQKAAVQGVIGEPIETQELNRQAAVTIRHSKLFTRYRVEISLRDDLKPPAGSQREAGGGPPGFRAEAAPGVYLLYSTYFDLWVETLPDWTIDFSGGVAFTGLRGHEFFIKTDTKNTADAADDVKTVEEDVAARSSFHPDIIALANVRHPAWRGVGFAFGVGLNNDADPRYFLGLSYLLGGKFIFNAGWAGGKVDELPAGQELHKPPINGENTLNTLTGRFRNAFYVGLGFTFVNREDQFKGAFAAAQRTTAEEAAGPGPAPANEPLAAPQSLDDMAGTYTRGTETVTVARQGDGLTIKLKPDAPAEALTRDAEREYHVGANAQRKVTFLLDTSKKVSSVEYIADGIGATYKKSASK